MNCEKLFTSNKFQLPFFKIIEQLHYHEILLFASCSKQICLTIKNVFLGFQEFKKSKIKQPPKACDDHCYYERYSKTKYNESLSKSERIDILDKLKKISKITKDLSNYFIYSIERKRYGYYEKVYKKDEHEFRCVNINDNLSYETKDNNTTIIIKDQFDDDEFSDVIYNYDFHNMIEYKKNGSIIMQYGINPDLRAFLNLAHYCWKGNDKSTFIENLDIPYDFGTPIGEFEYLNIVSSDEEENESEEECDICSDDDQCNHGKRWVQISSPSCSHTTYVLM